MARDPEKGVEVFEHESYGTLQLSRSHSSHKQPLFMTSFGHENYFTMTISSARIERNTKHSSDYRYTELQGTCVEIAMSEAQFARAITSVGIGGGVPCTIVYRRFGELERMADPPPAAGTLKSFAKEVGAMAARNLDRVKDVADIVADMMNGKVGKGKAELRKLLRLLEDAEEVTKRNVAFTVEQFEESAEDMMEQMQGEVEAHAHALLEALTNKALRDKLDEDDRKRLITLLEN